MPSNETAFMLESKDMIALRGWLLALALVAIAVVVSFFWLDRPLALFIHHQLPHNSQMLTHPLTRLPDPLIGIATIIFVALGLQRLAGRALSKIQAALKT